MLRADWDNSEQFQYMTEVENGWVHGLEYDPEKDTYSSENLTSENKDPDTILEATNTHDYDFTYSNFTNNAVDVDEVGIDAVNGVIDVINDHQVEERYTLTAVLENEDGRLELVFSGYDEDGSEVVKKDTSHIEWCPELAAAYEAVYNKIEKPGSMDEESVALYSEDGDSTVTSMNSISARKTVKRIDDFISSIKDPAEGLEDFEENGQITVEDKEHYGTAKGYSAARQVKTDLNRLKSAGLMDYTTEPLNSNGDEKSVDLKIAAEFLDGKGSLHEDVDGLSDFDIENHSGREELTDKRMS
jgi:hypothetical protein